MKKLLIFIFTTAASLVLLTSADGQDLGERIKRAACEKACERLYEKCMGTSGKALDRENQEDIESDAKDVVKEETCQASQEECLKSCE
ncbi:MAG: hypothetical protein A2W19_04765 [Spirochaetes bacterium RBG_16_49_21]|nr:MAG: hypothetical protein A2W19_04765 [Spirochaetes bacterium RBG_16_49_21]